MSTTQAKQKTQETAQIESLFKDHGFNDVEAYRQNRASIRVRILDERFAQKSRVQRDKIVAPILAKLPQETQMDITILLLLTPDETTESMANLEFEHPIPSRL
jgi:stress-induced morphogen